MPSTPTIRFGAGGWVRVEDSSMPGPLFLHFNEAGELQQLVLDGTGIGITAGDLRRIPLARFTALAFSRIDLWAGVWGQPVADVVAALDEVIHGNRNAPTDTSARLTPISSADGLTDRFLGEVAAAYRAAVARGERPNKALAAQVGFPAAARQSTVESWVYLARKKGLLSQTRKGSMG